MTYFPQRLQQLTGQKLGTRCISGQKAAIPVIHFTRSPMEVGVSGSVALGWAPTLSHISRKGGSHVTAGLGDGGLVHSGSGSFVGMLRTPGTAGSFPTTLCCYRTSWATTILVKSAGRTAAE